MPPSKTAGSKRKAARSRREKRRAAHLRAQDEIEAAEGGPAYAAGAFRENFYKMPSAARQKIPADLWHHGHGRFSPGHCVPMQANPGQMDIFHEEAKQLAKLNNKKGQNIHKSQRKQKHGGVRVSNGSLPSRVSSDDLRVATVSLKDMIFKPVNKVPSAPALVEYQPAKCSIASIDSCSKAFAMDTTLPPHPSELPLPPIEWLKPTSQSPLTIGRSLQTILACQVAA